MKTFFGQVLMVVLLCFFSQINYSQENFAPGYIILSNGDTLSGFIDYRKWVKNPREIKFRQDVDAKPSIYFPLDVMEFGVDNEIFVGEIVPAEISSLQTGDLKEDPALKLRVDTAFLQTLFRGEKSLFYYKDPQGKENFYILQEDSGFELLEYKKYLRKVDGKRVISENNLYKAQLRMYFENEAPVRAAIQKSAYNRGSLSKIFQKYYENAPSQVSFQREIEKNKLEKGVLAGGSLTFLNFKSEDFDYLTDADFDQSSNFTAGFFLDLILPRSQGKWSFYNELLFSSYKISGRYEEFQNEDFFEITTTEIGYAYLKWNTFARFNYPVGKVSLFVNGGMGNGLAIGETNYRKVYTKFYTTERTEESPALNEARKYEQSWILGTGLKFQKFSFEVRYESGNGMSKYSSLKSSVKRIHILAGYRF